MHAFFAKNQSKETQVASSTNLDGDRCHIMFSNIRSVKTNKAALDAFIQRHNPKIVVRGETWLKPQDPPLTLLHDCSTVYEKKRMKARGGGLAILIDRDYQAYNETLSESEHLLTIKILGGKKDTKMVTSFSEQYMRPQITRKKLKTTLRTLLTTSKKDIPTQPFLFWEISRSKNKKKRL